MIPSTLTLIVAATSTALSVNALPIFSGFFASPAARAPDAPHLLPRHLTDGQLAQGTNAFFRTLLLEAVCTPGQVGCINNNTATCSPEGNWEVTPCPSSSTCLALPATTDASGQGLVVTCTSPSFAQSRIEQAGGSQDLSVDYSIQSAPFNATNFDLTPTNTDSASPTETDTSTDLPTTTDTTVPSATCTPGDGDGDNDGDGDTETETITFSGEIPTGTDAATDPTATCTDIPSAEPTETEFITVIAFPDPANPSAYTFSTIPPVIQVPTPTETDTSLPTDTDLVTETGTDASFPTDTATDSYGDYTPTGTDPCPETITTPTDLPTDTPTDTELPPTTTTTTAAGEPTTLVVPPNFSISTPVPDISTVGTFVIPARRGMKRRVRRSS